MRLEAILPDDEALLMCAIKAQEAGWRDKLSILLNHHHCSVLARCHAYLRNRADAEDAAQETELRVYRAIRNFRGDASFRTWLFAIADRQCHDLSRKRSRHMLDDHLQALIAIHEQNLNSVSRNTDVEVEINRVLSNLPKPEQEVLILRFYRDLPIQDIAELLDLGLSATKMRLYRALAHFARLIRTEQVATDGA